MLTSMTRLQLLTVALVVLFLTDKSAGLACYDWYKEEVVFSSSQLSRCMIIIYYDGEVYGKTYLLRDEGAKKILKDKVDLTSGCVITTSFFSTAAIECYCNTDICGTTILEWDRMYRNSPIYDPESILAQYMKRQLQDTYKGKMLRDGIIPCFDTVNKKMVKSSNPDARCVFRQSSTCGAKGRDSYLIEDYKSISMGKTGEEFCWLKNNTDIMCVCHEEYCSSRYNTMMELWKRSDDYSHELNSTKCLQRKLKALDKADKLAADYFKKLHPDLHFGGRSEAANTTTQYTASSLTTKSVSSQTSEKESTSTRDARPLTNATQRVGASTIATTLIPVLYESVAHIRHNVVPAIIVNVVGDVIVVTIIFSYWQLWTKYGS